ACGVGVVIGAGGRSSFSLGSGGDAVAVVYVEGQIMGGDGGGVFDAPAAHSDRIVRSLKRAGEDGSIKAVVIRVDSPGGAVTASDEIFNQIVKLRAVKPVVVSMGGLAASGGYYISAGANRIFANPTTLTTSIGGISGDPRIVSYRGGGFLSGGTQSLAHLVGLPIPTEVLRSGQIPSGMQYLYVGP